MRHGNTFIGTLCPTTRVGERHDAVQMPITMYILYIEVYIKERRRKSQSPVNKESKQHSEKIPFTTQIRLRR